MSIARQVEIFGGRVVLKKIVATSLFSACAANRAFLAHSNFHVMAAFEVLNFDTAPQKRSCSKKSATVDLALRTSISIHDRKHVLAFRRTRS